MKTMKTDNKGRDKEEEEKVKDKEAKQRKGDEGVRAHCESFTGLLAAAFVSFGIT